VNAKQGWIVIVGAYLLLAFTPMGRHGDVYWVNWKQFESHFWALGFLTLIGVAIAGKWWRNDSTPRPTKPTWPEEPRSAAPEQVDRFRAEARARGYKRVSFVCRAPGAPQDAISTAGNTPRFRVNRATGRLEER
jgi:hypothetical protein